MGRKEVVTSSQMKEIERMASETGLSYYQMMENAGIAATQYIVEQEQTGKFGAVTGKQILVVCGKGNNGGDGLVAARLLAEKGAVVKIVLIEGDPKTEDAIQNWKLCRMRQIGMIHGDQDEAGVCIRGADIIIDAVYGTGFRGELREKARKTARMINECHARVYALDIPSGMNSDDGTADRDTILAGATIAFHRFKPAHMKEGSRKYCGNLFCADIGIDDALIHS